MLTQEKDTSVIIRACAPSDMLTVTSIYAHEVECGLATFEIDIPDVKEMSRRRQSILALNLPFLVAEKNGDVLGYAYASPFRPRPAYRYTVEDSVYLSPAARGQGVGKLLLTGVVDICEKGGYRQMIAAIGNSANAGSIGLHRSLGFDKTGVQKSVGFKLNQWVDVVIMQRTLAEGDITRPSR